MKEIKKGDVFTFKPNDTFMLEVEVLEVDEHGVIRIDWMNMLFKTQEFKLGIVRFIGCWVIKGFWIFKHRVFIRAADFDSFGLR
jgi:hypothetical protein